MAVTFLSGYGQGMIKTKTLTIDLAGFMAGAIFLAAFTGCVVDGPGSRAQVQTTDVYQDDYDYYPAYETYYSRRRHEYVYRDGNAWVRRPAPAGVTTEVLVASPSVRVDFHDSPERHHDNVVKSYPKTWKAPAKAQDRQNDHREEKKDGDKRN